MAELKDLVDNDLSRYRIKAFYEVQTSGDERGINRTATPECFLDEALAKFFAKGASSYGSDSKVVLIYVLVADADTEQGIALTGLNASKVVHLRVDAEERFKAVQVILAKLSPEERAIMGHPDPE